MINPWKEYSQVNPQRDNGHRRINSDIWASLISAKLPGAVYQVLMYVIDRSWGYDQLEVTLGYSQICKATGLSKPAVINAVRIAEQNHLLVIGHGDTKSMTPNTYLFNKHYDTWLTSKAIVTSKVNNTRTSKAIVTSPSKVPTSKVSYAIKNNIKNKNIKDINKEKNDWLSYQGVKNG